MEEEKVKRQKRTNENGVAQVEFVNLKWQMGNDPKLILFIVFLPYRS